MWAFLELIPFLFVLFVFLLLLNPLFWLFLLFFFPILLLIVFYFFSLEMLIFALINIIVVPKQLWYMFKNPILRKNHALEHATINVLEERYGELKDVGGLADIGGFYIFCGNALLTPDEVLSAAKEGLVRMKRGERELAVHPRCGTSITVTNLLLSVIFVVVLIFSGLFDFWHLVFAVALAFIISKPLGRWAQKYITTDADVGDMEIVGISIRPFVRYFGIPVPVSSARYFVETARIPRVERVF